MLLTGFGSLIQSFASSQGYQQLVRALEISVKALLDMTHQQCSGFVMVTVGIVVGMILLQVTGKRTSPVRSRILPSPILSPEVTSMKNPCSLDDFLWWRCSSTKDYSPHQLVGWNQNVLLHFDLEKHHCSRLEMSFFNVYIMHHDVVSTR